MANAAAKLFVAQLEERDLHSDYMDDDETIVRVGFKLENITAEIFVHFGESCEDVHLMGRGLGNIPADKVDKSYKVMNDMNSHFRWTKFYVDDDREILVEDDAVIQLDSCADEVFELVARMASIMDEAYGMIMEGLWAK